MYYIRNFLTSYSLCDIMDNFILDVDLRKYYALRKTSKIGNQEGLAL